MAEQMTDNPMDLIAKLAAAAGVSGINKLEGCWEYAVDGSWTIAVNGHRESATYKTVSVPPFSAYVEYNGWPAGIFGAYGGVLAAGEAANQETFCAAIEHAIRRVSKRPAAQHQAIERFIGGIKDEFAESPTSVLQRQRDANRDDGAGVWRADPPEKP